MDLSPPIEHLAVPLAQLLLRAQNGKSPLERHNCAYYLGEAAVKVVGATAVATWLHSEPPPDDPLWRRVELLARPSLGHWVAWIREVERALSPPILHIEVGATAAATRWAEQAIEREVLDRSALRSLRRAGPLGFFEQLVRYRNEVIGHGAQRVSGFYEVVGPLLLDAVLEQLGRIPWLWDGSVAGPDTPGRGFSVHDLTLAPFVMGATDDGLDRERVLFFNRAVVRGTKVRRVEYLDYATGETAELDTVGVLQELLGTDTIEDDATSERERVGDYLVESVLGQGAMGVVHQARQLGLGRKVALKTLSEALATDEVARRRFQREVQALARCDHPNVVKVLAAGERGGLPYYAMEFIEGRDLSHTDELEPRTAARLFEGAAQGLQHLHEHGIVHRDVKPANIMHAGDRLVIMDLGLARIGDASQGLTAADDRVLGTLRYMPPEQLTQNREGVDARADVYALGATLYEVLTGHPALDGDSRERLVHQ
ncbi:MAG: serine/threonine protein kinase, partial [Myxococcales bacterium]|nr:serine/threonine protein kinase [Myxococcales bacterium]